MGQKTYEFSPQDLLALLTHYTDGQIPLNGEVVNILVHPNVARKIALVVDSDEWESADPLFLGYDGKRTRSWSADGTETEWLQRAETPNRQ